MRMLVACNILLGVSLGGLSTSSSSTQSIQAGMVCAWPGEPESLVDAEGSWLPCDGRSLDVAKYPELFKAIGWKYGSGTDKEGKPDRSQFRVPDYRGLFLRGAAQGSQGRDPDAGSRSLHSDEKVEIGGVVGSLQGDQFASHSHNPKDRGHKHSMPTRSARQGTHGNPPVASDNGGGLAQSGTEMGNADIQDESRGGSETRPRNAYVLWVIRTR
jgi:microcystin-dependent protein